MNRTIIDVPLLLARVAACDWAPDWREQTSLGDVGGGEQLVQTGIPRVTGTVQLILPEPMVPFWRALAGKVRGRVNAFRWRMLDPASGFESDGGDWESNWDALRTGTYTEPRPQAQKVGASVAGASTIVVDETGLPRPICVGQWMSYADWPFLVTGRSGSGATVTLTVELLRVAIPNNGMIDAIARGVFGMTEPGQGWPAYGLERVALPQMTLIEWITGR